MVASASGSWTRSCSSERLRGQPFLDVTDEVVPRRHLAGQAEHPPQRWKARATRGEGGPASIRIQEQQARPGVRKYVRHIVRAVGGVEGYRHQAQAQGRLVATDPRDAVAQTHRYPVPRLQALALQSLLPARDEPSHVGPGVVAPNVALMLPVSD